MHKIVGAKIHDMSDRSPWYLATLARKHFIKANHHHFPTLMSIVKDATKRATFHKAIEIGEEAYHIIEDHGEHHKHRRMKVMRKLMEAYSFDGKLDKFIALESKWKVVC
jgi:hypothetical protein